MLSGMGAAIEMSAVGWVPDGMPVLRDLNLRVADGEARAIVGSPGSGRTAVLRVLLGLIEPDVGRATILGLDCWSDAVALHRLVSSPPVMTMWPTLTVMETLGFVHQLAGEGECSRCRELLERFGIDAGEPVGELPVTDLHAVSLVAACCRPARVFLIDDALTGTSADQAREAIAVLNELREKGATVLLTGGPHDGLERVADSVTTIIAGHLAGVSASVA